MLRFGRQRKKLRDFCQDTTQNRDKEIKTHLIRKDAR